MSFQARTVPFSVFPPVSNKIHPKFFDVLKIYLVIELIGNQTKALKSEFDYLIESFCLLVVFESLLQMKCLQILTPRTNHCCLPLLLWLWSPFLTWFFRHEILFFRRYKATIEKSLAPLYLRWFIQLRKKCDPKPIVATFQHVVGEPYFHGRSAHGHPVFKI